MVNFNAVKHERGGAEGWNKSKMEVADARGVKTMGGKTRKQKFIEIND